ncbi:MAG: hypothetical protein RLZ63_1005 [Pseudomonadota bacterium]
MRELARKLGAWSRLRPTSLGCAWQEGLMAGVQLQAVGRGEAAAYHVKALHASAHAWGSEQLAQGLATGLPWEPLKKGMQAGNTLLALACPQAWVASGQYAAEAGSKRQTVLADIQVLAAQAVGEDYSQVCFDAQERSGEPWQWWATSQNWVRQVQADLKPLGWGLRRVSPQQWAQQQALSRLDGGESSLQARAPMDWRFSCEPQHPPATVLDWLQTWGATAQGLRLAACGMALPA